MKVAVTGGAGFIGGNLVRMLVARHEIDEVVVLDDLSTGHRDNLADVACDLIEGSILDPDAVDEALTGASSVVHLAARPSVPRSVTDPMASHAANATGTAEVLEGARRAACGHVVVASSSSVYGANPTLPKSEDLVPRPMSPYAASKLATESYALAWGHCYDLGVLAFRFFNVFGPLQPAGHAYAAVVPAFVDAALRGKPIPMHGDGTQSRDFTFIDTVTTVITEAVIGRVASAEPVNLAFGTRTDLRSLTQLLGEQLGRELAVEHQPPRAGDVPHSQADSSRLQGLFPNVEPVPLAVGLERTLDWFRTLPEYPAS